MEAKLGLDHQNNQVSRKTSRPLVFPDHSLVFICELPSKEDQTAEEGQESIKVKLPAQCNVYQLRLRLCMLAQVTSQMSDPLELLDPEKYRLLYTKEGNQYEIYDDSQIVRTLDLPWVLNAAGHRTALVKVSPQPEVSEEEKSYHHVLAELIGFDLDSTHANRLDELNFTRRKFASPRQEEIRKRDLRAYATEPWTTSAPLPKDQQVLLARKLSVTLYYGSRNLRIQVVVQETPDGLKKIMWESMSKHTKYFKSWSADHVLKVCGREEFLCGDFPLWHFVWVRHCMKNTQDLHLSVVAMGSLPDDTVKIKDWPMVDSLTGLSSSHEELSLEGKEVDEILMISLWDCDRKFRVKLLGFDIPDLPGKIPQLVHVEASIIYGSKVVSSVSSSPKAIADEVLWNSWLEFDILLRDLPRGAKLGFTINESTQHGSTKESKSPTKELKSLSSGKAADIPKGKQKVLYFANLQLIDHRSVLSQGPHTLHMWPFSEQEGEGCTYEADKLSTATNPDVAKSMAITFLLDRYNFPVVLPHSTTYNDTPSPPSTLSPTSSPSSPLPMFGSSPSSPVSMGSPTTSLLSTDKSRLRNIRQQSYTSNLPQFLRTVDWLKPSVVQDVHWLLSHWEPQDLELPVALELLSVDYADEKVRELAVQRLETLTNEEVLRYLLQLVQTLKVEPYHDSSLARFLIRRALRSKRIGHYFFWYLRSEVAACPFFRQRMAVILESYLLGCGQAMLSEFQRQVHVVTSLSDVAIRMKQFFPEKNDLTPAAPQLLQEFLQEYNLPSDFQVPFDPRIRAGSILLDRCKVMASKKKPLWLEFSCVASQAPPTPPVGIIFKHGDDLRQDMLVIQTLMLMDSIWQEKSMDLNLVPYGCISTGYNIGMIEIVRDAFTIAGVQKSQGGTVAAFKNDALYKWIESRCPLDEKHYHAMEKFVTSCAGYCVATYVLGIGDRHNDNIMITDQGNLFHIDFGHILGNTKSFLGVSRERVPFVLTPDFLYVMGKVKGQTSLCFQRFKEICIQAYLSLRSQSRLLLTLFSLMLPTGIPELSTAQDMRYLRMALQEDCSEVEARQHFLQQINECEKLGWTVQANWWIHLLVGMK
ncbi:phosphatidylinositol 4,5-bisphosphate 3-kinase catalytic subunit gamma isoform [Chanos chanos]|uniref:phosphatidylinositol 3-kinase n=1 Tax=Chanos chanos TaxID=29144 RepID=A0A6J2UU83_CHACN|nr:phosphatidylinositol 4,5-bisphosphate 3-kinase catalytic subunit gamma isoform-like [Chanos chanos]